MLNKDEYNQDEYNDYYAQETRGAEISGKDSDDSSAKKGIVLLLLLLLVAVGGYFGWRSMDPSCEVKEIDLNQTNDTVKVVEENGNQESKVETTQKAKIAEEVEKSIASSDIKNGNMDPEDIANIIQMVMLKMNTDKMDESSSSTTDNSENQVKDSQLMESLTDAKVDSLSSISNEAKTILNKDTDIYNKVVLEASETDSSDELSRLSDEISNFINSENTSTPKMVDNSYTESITKEVKTREKEMRYHIVKKGDTLGKIAKKYYGNVMEFKKIQQANPDILRRPEKIHIGQKIRLP
jgi:nucleoid-associated protein YgaU